VTTHVLFVTDMSGSMHDLAEDVRGGFNTYLADLRKDVEANGTDYRMSVTVFDTRFMPLCVAAELADVPDFTQANYAPTGMTALLDAVGRTVGEFDTATTLGDDDRVLLVIQTDGGENSSREWTWEKIRTLLDERERTGKWSIVYLGQGVTAWEQGSRFGASTQVVGVAGTSKGTASSYSGLSMATVVYAETGVARDVGAAVAAATVGLGEDD
jgi:uncharacterized protein YegL